MSTGDLAMSASRKAAPGPPVRAVTRSLWLRAIGAVILLVLIARFIDLDQVWPVMRSLTPAAGVFILALTAVAWSIGIVKWKILLPEVRLADIAAFYLIGLLYSLVLPGQLAGEAVKAARLAARGPALGHVSASVVIDRLTSLVGLGVVAGLGLSLSGHHGETFRALAWIIWLVTTAFIAMVFVIRVPAVSRAAARSRYRFARSWAEFGTDRALVVKSLVLAIAFQLANVAIVTAIAAGLNVPFAFADVAWVVGVVSILTLVPISFGGVGVREAGFVGLLALIGIPAAQALSVSLICSLIIVIGALAGLLVELRWLQRKAQ